MTSGQRSETTSDILADSIFKLEMDAVGIVSLAEWKGTKLEETALKLLPQAHSVVVFASEIYQEILDLTSSPGRIMGEASLMDFLDRDDDHLCSRLTKAAYEVTKMSHKLGLKALPLAAEGCPLDTRFVESVFSYKHAGQAAGLGKMGWHSLLITPAFGPRVRLSCCLTEAALETTKTGEMALTCDGCGICLDICPAHALMTPTNDEPYTMDKFACRTFRNAAGGCAECMRVCPLSR